MLRLRSVRGRHWITFKGPAGHHRHYKIRQEAETEVADGQATRTILAGLGFQPVFRYQKYRTIYTAPGSWSGGEVMVDETPIGDFVELEGKPAWIRRMARELGARPQQFITKDYAVLYADWCRRHRRRAAHMIFRRKRPLSA
jgi:adenylate cyclase class 2